MASGYALPLGSNHHHHHHPYGHGHHSYSTSHLAPRTEPPPAGGNGFVKKAASNGSLYTHAEVSRETSPLASPYADHTPSLDPFVFAAPANSKAHQHNHHDNSHHDHDHDHAHSHSHSHSHAHARSHSSLTLPMKPRPSRPRGESDLGRPADAYYSEGTRDVSPASTSWFSLPEALTSLLIPLPYIFASAAYSSGSGLEDDGLPPLSAYAKLQKSVLEGTAEETTHHIVRDGSGLVQACTLTAGTLLLVGIFAQARIADRTLDRRKDKPDIAPQWREIATPQAAQSMLLRALGVGLPFYAATQIGGLRTGLLLLLHFASDLTSFEAGRGFDWRHILTTRKASLGFILLCMLLDMTGLTFKAPTTDVALGYLALAGSIFMVRPPLPTAAVAMQTPSTPRSSWSRAGAVSPLVCSLGDANITLAAGVASFIFAVFLSVLFSATPSISLSSLTLAALSLATSAAAIFFTDPASLNSKNRFGLGVGCFLTAACAFLFSPSSLGTVINGGLSALSFVSVLYDTSSVAAHRHHDQHVHEHAHNTHSHHHHDHSSHSIFTKYILDNCEPGSLVHGIVSEKDSRRIAYFTCLNFGFMFVQGVYGYLSGSLGLLSDTVHMFFDCLGLVVGLGAAVASKWPTSPERPYGWGKLNTLAGFGNGIFLMLVSVEFVWEAVEGILEKKDLTHVKELLIVSSLGLAVNLVGLLAFGHAHHGHDHGHDHGHSHGHGHGHDHNENMEGIYLHVMADAGGSLAVIISTALTLWQPWYAWDPIATILIAGLIFAAAVPLVTSSGQKLLLVVPDGLEYHIKNTLQELGELRGVVGYAGVRFWADEGEGHGGHDHEHGHGEGCSGHAHDHSGHDHGHGRRSHSHDHEHSHHEHEHEHDYAHTHQRPGRVLGVIHIITTASAPPAEIEDIRRRVDAFLRERGIDAVVHVEREEEKGVGSLCWCGGGPGGGH